LGEGGKGEKRETGAMGERYGVACKGLGTRAGKGARIFRRLALDGHTRALSHRGWGVVWGADEHRLAGLAGGGEAGLRRGV
jgi:hypothetical protein